MFLEIRRSGKHSSRWLGSTVSPRLLLDETRPKALPLPDTDVLYVKLFSTVFVVLNSSEAISDLLEKRSAIYSDRVSRLFDPLACSLSPT